MGIFGRIKEIIENNVSDVFYSVHSPQHLANCKAAITIQQKQLDEVRQALALTKEKRLELANSRTKWGQQVQRWTDQASQFLAENKKKEIVIKALTKKNECEQQFTQYDQMLSSCDNQISQLERRIAHLEQEIQKAQNEYDALVLEIEQREKIR